MRFPPEYIDLAKTDKLTLYRLAVDRKYAHPENKGGSSESIGVCRADRLPVLNFAVRTIMREMPVEEALELLHTELDALEQCRWTAPGDEVPNA